LLHKEVRELKKIFLILGLALLLPVVSFAAGAGGSANKYHLKYTKIGHDGVGTEAWSATADADSLDNWTLAIAAATDFGVNETTTVVETGNMVCPFGAGAFAGIFGEWATSDSIRIVPQVSMDKASWMNLGTITMVGTVDYDPIVEAATMVTTPSWPYMRFIIDHYDGSAKATYISSVTLWFVRYEKDE